MVQTEVNRAFTWGFVLSEQDLRRIFGSCLEHCKEAGSEEPRSSIEAKLQDGSIVRSSDVEEIVKLENSGSKSLERLIMTFDDGENSSDWSIEISLNNASKGERTWRSVSLKVVSSSRNWAFVASSELEERLRKTKIISWPYIVSRKWVTLVFMLLCVVGMFGAAIYFDGDSYMPQTGQALQEKYNNGEIVDAVQAMIFVEQYRYKNRPRAVDFLLPQLVTAVVVLSSMLLIVLVVPRLRTSYNFYWGDQIAIYDRQRARMKSIWAFIVFGVFASLVAGWILRAG